MATIDYGVYGQFGHTVSGSREDLIQMIVNIDPWDTPWMSRFWNAPPLPRLEWVEKEKGEAVAVHGFGFHPGVPGQSPGHWVAVHE